MNKFIETKESNFGQAILININQVARVECLDNGNAVFYSRVDGKHGVLTELKFDEARHLLKGLLLLP